MVSSLAVGQSGQVLGEVRGGRPRPVRLAYVAAAPASLRFLVGQASYLRARGFEIHVVCTPGAELDEFCGSQDCTAHETPISRSITPLRDMECVLRMARLLRTTRADMVEAHMSKAGLVGMAAACLAGIPLRIYKNHGVAFSSAAGWKRKVLRSAERVACALATHVHCVSRSVSALMVAEGCCQEAKICVPGHGSCGTDARVRFNPRRFDASTRRQVRASCGIPPEALVLGFVGRIARLKGLDCLAQAWCILREEFPALHLLLIGGEEPRNPVAPETAELLRSDPQVHLLGQIADTAPYYAAMDVQSLPSFHEGLPISLLEGSAMELPLVASDIPGNVDAIERGATGTLVPPRNAKALAEAVGRYLRDPELRRRHGQAGRKRVLTFFQQEMVWEAVYQEYQRLLYGDANAAHQRRAA